MRKFQLTNNILLIDLLMNKTNDLSHNIELANKYSANYLYPGYDIYFIHGWFYSYILSISENSDDLWFPDYLVLDEDKITDNKLFTKFIDNLLLIYTTLVNNAFEKNLPISVLVDVNNINVTIVNLSVIEQSNLLNWLYGYLSGWLVTWNDGLDQYFKDHKNLEDKFYQDMFYLTGAFILLDNQLKPQLSEMILSDYNDLKLDLFDIWDLKEPEIIQEFKKLNLNNDSFDILNGVSNSLNSLFQIMRIIDEKNL